MRNSQFKKTLNWPFYTFKQNSIENLWVIVKKRLQKTVTFDDRNEMVHRNWETLDAAYKLVGLKRRTAAARQQGVRRLA